MLTKSSCRVPRRREPQAWDLRKECNSKCFLVSALRSVSKSIYWPHRRTAFYGIQDIAEVHEDSSPSFSRRRGKGHPRVNVGTSGVFKKT